MAIAVQRYFLFFRTFETILLTFFSSSLVAADTISSKASSVTFQWVALNAWTRAFALIVLLRTKRAGSLTASVTRSTTSACVTTEEIVASTFVARMLPFRTIAAQALDLHWTVSRKLLRKKYLAPVPMMSALETVFAMRI